MELLKGIVDNIEEGVKDNMKRYQEIKFWHKIIFSLINGILTFALTFILSILHLSIISIIFLSFLISSSVVLCGIYSTSNIIFILCINPFISLLNFF